MSSRFQFRWGIPEWDVGSTDIPNPIFQYYSKVPWTKNGMSGFGITNTEAMFILHLASFHFESARGEARPSLTQTLRKRMGYKTNQGIVNTMKSLEDKGLIIVERTQGRCNKYDFRPFSEGIMNLWQADHPSTKVDDHPSTKVDPKKKKNKKKKDYAPPDYLSHCADLSNRQREEKPWTVPPDAGGADTFADGPVDAFCEVIAGIPPSMLPAKKRQSWARGLRQIAERWSTEEYVVTAKVMEGAIRAVPDSDIGWKTYKSPYAGSFEDDIGPLLLNNEVGQPKVLKVGH